MNTAATVVLPSLTAIVIAAMIFLYFAYFNKGGKSRLKMSLAEGSVEIETDKVPQTREVLSAQDPATHYVDSERGFSFLLPKRATWSQPRVLHGVSAIENDRGIVIEPEILQTVRIQQSLSPLWPMLGEVVAVRITTAEQLNVTTTKAVSSPDIKYTYERLKELNKEGGSNMPEEQLEELIAKVVRQGILQAKIQNEFIVHAFDKRVVPPGIRVPFAKAFFAISALLQLGGFAENIAFRAGNILITGMAELQNVEIDGQVSNLRVDRVYYFTEGRSHFYLVQVSFSPQTKESLETWEDLKELLDSFRVIGR